MTRINSLTILNNTATVFARSGIDDFSIRKLAKAIPITPSVLYHYFTNQDELLRAMFDHLNRELGKKRKALPKPDTATEMLKQRIAFQFDNQEAIVAVLKYYFSFRHTFPRFKNGFVPDKSALHIEEVLKYGQETGEFVVKDLEADAKVIAHSLNGYLLEYYPYMPDEKEKKQLVDDISTFLLRALTKGGEKHERN